MSLLVHALRPFPPSLSSLRSSTLFRCLSTSTLVPVKNGPGTQAYLETLPEEKDNGIVVLTLNRPEAKNALSVKLLEELSTTLRILRFSPSSLSLSPRVLILRSTVPSTFCAGADLKERRTMSVPEVDKFLHDLRKMLGDLESMPIPTIASLEGVALGGGLELALACDLRVGGSAPTQIGLPETKLGIIPGAGGTQRLTRLLGPSRAKDLIFSGRRLGSEEALNIGILDHLAQSPDTAFSKSVDLAREMLPNAPLAIRAAKLAIDRATQLDLESGLDFERACYNTVIPTRDRQEALKAFAEKRVPVFKGE